MPRTVHKSAIKFNKEPLSYFLLKTQKYYKGINSSDSFYCWLEFEELKSRITLNKVMILNVMVEIRLSL